MKPIQANKDELAASSREFYERAYLKLSYSLLLASLSMMFLGFASSTGGLCQENRYYARSGYDDTLKTSEANAAAGYGFTCFISVCAAILSFAAAILISPFVSSKKEAELIQSPIDLAKEGVPLQVEEVVIEESPSHVQVHEDAQENSI